MDCTLADVGAVGNLPLPQFQIDIQPKDFTRLAHGHSFSGHRDLLFGGHAVRSSQKFSPGPSRLPVLK